MTPSESGNHAAPVLAGVRVPFLLGAPEVAALKTDALGLARRLPKVELHLHLEATMRPETVSALAHRYEPDSPLCRAGWQQNYWTFRDLPGFLAEAGRVISTCIRTVDDYHRVARECFEDLAGQHVLYAEVSFGLRAPGRPSSIPLREVVDAIDQARQEVEARMPLRVGLVLGLSRSRLLEEDEKTVAQLACQWVTEAARAHEDGVPLVGIDLHGDEQAVPDVKPFVSAFRLAKEAALGRRAHAGEGAGPESVWDCVRLLDVQRIAHGVRAIEDPGLLAHLAERKIALDVCPTSNVLLGIVPAWNAHPVHALHRAGVPVTISSDDPIAFGTSITTELALLQQHLGLPLSELREFMTDAATHCFAPDDVQAELVRSIEETWPD